MGYWRKDEDDELWYKGSSIVEGKFDWMSPKNIKFNFPVVKAFIEDDALVEMTVTSPNLGFTYTFQKQRKPPSDQS